jgi:Ni,Fe-hydrogenase III small subunit
MPSQITHLRELELERQGQQRPLERARRHPHQGGLRARPTAHEQPLAAAVGPGVLRDGDDVRGHDVNDMDRFNMFPFRASPRQADVLIVAGTLTTKMAGPLVRLWEQMPEPKWCVAMGDCTCSGGATSAPTPRSKASTASCPWMSTCPAARPRPEGLIYGMLKLQQLILERRGTWAERRVGPSVPAGV